MNSHSLVSPRARRRNRKLPPPIVIPTPLALGHAALVQLDRLTDRAERFRNVEQPVVADAFAEAHRLLAIVLKSPDREHQREGRLQIDMLWRMFPDGPRGLCPVVDLAALRARRAS